MVKLLGASLSLLLIGASAARADEAYDACMKTATSNVDFSQCGGAYVKRADDALNAAWKQTYKLATGPNPEKLPFPEQAPDLDKKKTPFFFAQSGGGGGEGGLLPSPPHKTHLF